MKIDLTGKTFFWLTVNKWVGKNKKNENLWECTCKCGNKKIVPTNYLTGCKTKSCGCYNSKRYKDIKSGTRFGRLVVLKMVGKDLRNYKLYECICDCGKKVVVKGASLKCGHTKSCGYCNKYYCNYNLLKGFYSVDKRLHGIYKNMIERCYNKNSISYKYYGAKGVRVCPEWLADEMRFFDFSYENGYNNENVLDRIDSNGDYCPQNCQWISRGENTLRMWFKRKNGYDPTKDEFELFISSK